ncbi:MAG: TonB-dependent receptor [bacterium]|nr:TonB-dependent receptor [bacterium]
MRPDQLSSWLATAALIAALAIARSAPAEEPALPEPLAPEAAAPTGEPEIAVDADREIDLANIVTSAAKGVTTVQEAPAIITIITADDIKARGFRFLGDAVATIPGWMHVQVVGSQVEMPMVRGIVQSALLMRDGLSLFDPFGNVAWFGRTQPIENIKRIEVVTGPGGVLWGANSFLGVLNLITKDAEDVAGLEVSAAYGDGPGNKQDFKAYALFGKTFFNGKLKLFQHASYESFIGQVSDIPQFIASAAAPQPAGTAYYGANRLVDPLRSWMVILDGKYSLGPVNLYYMLPFGDIHPQLTFNSAVVPNDTWNDYDRYGVLEYKDRHFKDRFGLTIKAYGAQFVRDFSIQLLPRSYFFPAFGSNYGGLNFSFAGQRIVRFGGTVDADVTLPFGLRLLFGGEAFYEGISDSKEVFPAPEDPRDLPLLCPVHGDGMGGYTRVPTCPRGYLSDDNRVVVAGYADLQWRPFATLALDGGVRLQAGYGSLGYGLQPLYSGAVVWNFRPDYHVKLNYATGFRPPVFQDTSGIPGGVSIGASRTLKNEASQSFQGEINARLLKNVRLVRELVVRVNYSYTVLSDVITIQHSSYVNTGRRGIHSVEGYLKLYLNGDHFLQASYTYLHQSSTDFGVVTAAPHHWISVGASFNLIKNTLAVNTNLLVTAAYDDSNRYPSQSMPVPGTTTGALYTDLTRDRLTPVAVLQLGFRLRFFAERLSISGQLYNVLNQHYAYPDAQSDLAPTLEMMANPAPGISFHGSVAYRF